MQRYLLERSSHSDDLSQIEYTVRMEDLVCPAMDFRCVKRGGVFVLHVRSWGRWRIRIGGGIGEEVAVMRREVDGLFELTVRTNAFYVSFDSERLV